MVVMPNFLDMTTTLYLDSTYTITLVPGFTFPFTEVFRVWIDLNQDGIFQEPAELVFAPDPSNMTVTGNITIPATANIGLTRMRVSMRFFTEATACEEGFTFGEVEDYCVNIENFFKPCEEPVNFAASSITHESAILTWEEAIFTTIGYTIRYRKLGETDWIEVNSIDLAEPLLDLEICTDYEAQIRAVCETDFTDWSPTLTFKTMCTVGTDDLNTVSNITAFPNPFIDGLSLEVDLANTTDIQIQIFDNTGRRVHTDALPTMRSGKNIYVVEGIKNQPAGLYWVHVTDGRDFSNAIKVIKSR